MQFEKNNTGSTQIVRGNGDSSDVPGTHSGWEIAASLNVSGQPEK